MDTKNRTITYIQNGLKFMKVPYLAERAIYDLECSRSLSVLVDLDIPTGNGELFRIKGDAEKLITIVKESGKTFIKGFNESTLLFTQVVNKDLLGHHIISLNINYPIYNSSFNPEFEFFVDGINEKTFTYSFETYLDKLELNGFNSSINNKYGALIVRKNKVFTDKELKDYVKRINEVYENGTLEIKPSNIAYNEPKYKYDEIIFNNTFESRNGIKPTRQINVDNFYSIKENFEYVPSLRGEGIGDNVYAIKGQELVYDLGLNESGTVAIRGKTLLDKDVTLLQLLNDDLNIKIEKNASNNLRVLVNNVLKSTISDTDTGFKNIVVTFSKVLASSSLESTTYNINVYKNGTSILSTSVTGESTTASLEVYLGKGKDEEVEEELLGYIDKLVYTNIECDEEEVSSICSHLNHNEYCCNKFDCASRIETKTINTSSNKVIKKDYTYNNLFENFPTIPLYMSVNRVPETEVLSVDGVTKETRSYAYDCLKRVKMVYVGDTLTTYTYDNKGYLTKSVEGDTTKTYAYDNLGNIVNKDGVTLTYDGLLLRRYGSTLINYQGMYPINEVVNGVVTKTYDWFGSKLSSIVSDKTYEFSYNARGLRERKLVKTSTRSEQEIDYFYDLNGRLIVETRYQYTSTGLKVKMCDIIYMYDATGLLYGFRYNNVDYYYDRDVLGNINHIILANGQVVATYKYDAYGSHHVYSSSGQLNTNASFIGNINPFRYKGYYYDVETQLFWVSSRYYSPELCRWISPDSIEYLDPESINGLNLYAYCNNDPVNKYDPTGHSAESIWKIVGSVAIIAALGVLTIVSAGATSGLLAVAAPIISGAFWGATAGAITGGITGALNAYSSGGSILDGVADGMFSGTLSGAATGAISGAFSYLQFPTSFLNKIDPNIRFLPEMLNIGVQTLGNGVISMTSSLLSGNSIEAAKMAFLFGMAGGFMGANVAGQVAKSVWRSGLDSLGLSASEYLVTQWLGV